MQTFLPYLGEAETPLAYFEECSGLLDQKRLGKQRVENLQIMKALTTGRGWINHPVTKMWRGYEFSLLTYQKAICDEWTINLGFDDTCFVKTAALYFSHFTQDDDGPTPPWLGDPLMVRTHQANLLRKDYEYYIQRFPEWKDKPMEDILFTPYYYPPTK